MDIRRRAILSEILYGGGSNEEPINIDNYLTIEARENGLTASLSVNACEYCVDGDGNWKTLSAGTATESINSGQTLSFRGNLTPNSSDGIGRFTINKKYNLKGNCMSMLFGNNAINNYSLSGKNYAFYKLFQNCSNIINVSNNFLPATTLASSCYRAMFQGCYNLITAPELPATTLASKCYNGMFYDCTSLTTAPELPATTLAEHCYAAMFLRCKKINYIKMLATDISARYCLNLWVYGVTSIGTFVKNPAMTILPTGESGIPSGWTVVDDGEPIIDINNYLTIEARENGLTASLSKNACEYCVDGDGNWKTLSAGTATESINAGQTLSFRGNLNPVSYEGIGTFTISKKCNLKGNCMSMLFGDEARDNYSLSGKRYAFYQLFYNCTNIVNVSSNFLPATTLDNYCYSQIFNGCSSLTTAPSLPATTMAFNCYIYMFQNCSSLTTAPELPATTLANYCYSYMFYGCTSLTTAPELPATTLVNGCYHEMFQNCTNLTNSPELPATTLASSCYYKMFCGCTSLTTAPELPATTLANDCYSYMFSGCSKLNYIKMLATDISASYCLNGWVSSVAPTGTFVKHPDMTSLPTGESGIPSGWTVVNDGEESEESNLSLVIDYNNLTQNDVDQIINYMVDNGWTTDNRIDVQVINSNITVLYKNTEYPITWIIRSDGGNVGGSFWLMLYTTDIYNMPYFAIDEESLGIRFED